MSSLPPWSFSSLTKFETCPHQYYITKVLKLVKEPPTEATDWGQYVHKALELRVLNKTPLPEKISAYEHIASKFDRLSGDVFAEREYGLTKSLKPTGFGDADCWVRGIIDFGVVQHKKAFLADWKTGKVKPSDQLKLSAALVMQSHPEVDDTKTSFIWLAHDKTTSGKHCRADLPEIWGEFASRAARLEHAFNADKWQKKTSGLCAGWCPVGREHCEFWRPKRPK